MKKTMIAVFTLLMAAVSANAFEIGGGVGAFIPMGSDAKDIYDTGYSANAYADFDIFGPVALRVLGMYYSADGTENGVSQRLKGFGGGALVMVKPDLGMIQPYAGVGYGAFRTQWGNHNSHYVPGAHNKTREWGYGLIGQAGVNVTVSKIQLGANATYFMNETKSDLELGGLTAGVNIGYRF